MSYPNKANSSAKNTLLSINQLIKLIKGGHKNDEETHGHEYRSIINLINASTDLAKACIRQVEYYREVKKTTMTDPTISHFDEFVIVHRNMALCLAENTLRQVNQLNNLINDGEKNNEEAGGDEWNAIHILCNAASELAELCEAQLKHYMERENENKIR